MDPYSTLHGRFEAVAYRLPDQIAVSMQNGERFTYSELDTESNRLAHLLRNRGVRPNTLVGLSMNPGPRLIIGMLGICKAGGAYVPIDPRFKSKRMETILDDSGVELVVTESEVTAALPLRSARAICIDEEQTTLSKMPAEALRNSATQDSLAYAIYTSGSSGMPKGVLIEHHSVIRLFDATAPWFSFGPDDVWTLFHSASFDFSVWEIWGALLHGGELVIVPHVVTRSPSKFREVLKQKKITVLNQTPSAFRQLVEADRDCNDDGLSLRVIIFGGEALDVRILEPWIARYGIQKPRLVNMYGITETTVHVTYKQITREDLKRPDRSPIGIPISDLDIQLIDESGNPVPDGNQGEIWIAGPGLARGYLNKPDQTEANFTDDPPFSSQGRRWYRSGDLAIRSANGEMAFVGRRDGQLKIRGHRIEPKEVEVAMESHPHVAMAAVAKQESKEGERLVGFVVVPQDTSERIQPDAFKRSLALHVAAELPDYMRPSVYTILKELPLTSNGKLDRVSLPASIPDPSDALAMYGDSASVRHLVKNLCEELLGFSRVDGDDNLFDLGIDSISMASLFVRINERFGTCLEPFMLADFTINEIANWLEQEAIQLQPGSNHD